MPEENPKITEINAPSQRSKMSMGGRVYRRTYSYSSNEVTWEAEQPTCNSHPWWSVSTKLFKRLEVLFQARVEHELRAEPMQARAITPTYTGP